MSTGFYTFFNYGGGGHGGTTRIGSGWRAVFAVLEGSQARVLDWTDGCVAKIKRSEFERLSKPDAPRKLIVRRCLKRAPRTSLRRLCRNTMKEE